MWRRVVAQLNEMMSEALANASLTRDTVQRQVVHLQAEVRLVSYACRCSDA
jgi:3-oxoacyl-[acyl-carrier-protein] synthase III